MAKQKQSSREIYEILKDEIQYLILKPGSQIIDIKLTETFGVSRTPVREALLRLASDGLIDIFPQNGTFVSKINFKTAMDVAYMRHLLDTDISMALCKKKTPVRDAVDEALYFMSSAVKKNDIIQFVQQNDHFHQSLFKVAGHEIIWNIIETSQAHNNRVRMLDMQRPGTMEPSLKEHMQIVEYIESGNSESLKKIMEHHHDTSHVQERETLFRNLYPDYFIA